MRIGTSSILLEVERVRARHGAVSIKKASVLNVSCEIRLRKGPHLHMVR
jgi:hypothetical protein